MSTIRAKAEREPPGCGEGETRVHFGAITELKLTSFGSSTGLPETTHVAKNVLQLLQRTSHSLIDALQLKQLHRGVAGSVGVYCEKMETASFLTSAIL